ncbi:MAG: ImmA/IrrE family metallo-endopeptidase [Chloroflexi bacterium]|nr:ImmA/IrrE family metallo-endopeptidase [Chloroflexota bacterium]
MQSLYRRLEKAGFDTAFVRNRVLPDWWDDSLAANPANLAIAEMAIARMLGLPIASLRDPAIPLSLPLASTARLKRTADVDPSALAPAVRVAERVASHLMPYLIGVSGYGGERSASSVRAEILETAPDVGLAQLVDFAWRTGILVAQLADRPAMTGKLHGVAMFCDEQPVIVLAANGRLSDSPPWLAFRLGHELGHLMLGHVREGEQPIFDASRSLDDPDMEERQANAFALELLTGDQAPAFAPEYGLTATRLALLAPAYGQTHKIDPGTVALIYGHSACRMGVAQNALKEMGLTSGAHEIVAERLRSHLQEDLPETVARAAALAGVQ